MNTKTSKIPTYVPLDGKTKIDSEKLTKLTKNLHNEIKLAIDKNYQLQWNQHKEKIVNDIATLLVTKSDNEVETYINQIKQNLQSKPVKKGRPKKKPSPWQYVLDNLEENYT